MGHETEQLKILIADDDACFRSLVVELALGMGLAPVAVSDGIEALECVNNQRFSLALVDLKMPGMSGIDLLARLREELPELPVVIITGFGSIETAVEAMKIGAVDYLTKPSSITEIRKTISRVLDGWRSAVGLQPGGPGSAQPRLDGADAGEGKEKFGIIGRSKSMRSVYERIEVMRQADNTVLITGESGVGKELVAKAIHQCGDRSGEPFIPIDCSVLGLNIVESELFGHVKGAFTDAHYSKTGLLKLAGRGTVFFDEITEIPLVVQAKLLRSIQEREIRPLGSSSIEKIEARIIAATNRQLEKAVSEGAFREDLFYRLHVIPIFVPPLRERKDDIPLLVDHFLAKHSTEKRPVTGVSPGALEALLGYDWPGNVRELENVLQQAIAFGSGSFVRPIDLPKNLRDRASREKYPGDGAPQKQDLGERSTVTFTAGEEATPETPGIKPLKELEKDAILRALAIASGNKVDAARILGIGKTTLYEKLKKYMLE
jgi:two-component system response regulator HydG